MNRPREALAGLTLKDGWVVRQLVPKSQTDTGSNFSAGYLVEDPSGKRYFLKAIDFLDAMTASDPARALQELTAAFNLERDVLEIGRRMSCVVTNVADGSVALATGPSSVVQYLIFELAKSNLRHMTIASAKLPMSTALIALRRVATGLRQLHQSQVAHQDTKPSNVLNFGGEEFKVADLGRASVKGRMAPHDSAKWAGDPLYSPPELLYGHLDPEFNVRRVGCDAYMLGGLATFLITHTSMTALIMNALAPSAHPVNWHGSYAQVLPQIRQAFAQVLDNIRQSLPSKALYADELVECISQLCEPDPALRGHPNTRAVQRGGGNIYDLERYLSIFDRLATQARISERQSVTR